MSSDMNAVKNSADKTIEREHINSWDWVHAKRYCQRYLDQQHYDLERTDIDDARAFTTAIIVTYSRPFSGNRDRNGKPARVARRYRDGLSPEATIVHDRVVSLRNKVFAHSDASHHNVQIGKTPGNALMTTSRDSIAPLTQPEVECLISNIKQFESLNASLLSDAIAKRLGVDR